MEHLDKRYAAACAQILREDDLAVPDAVAEKLKKKTFAAQLIEDGEALYLKLYGYRHFMLTMIVPLLKNMGLSVHSEISYEIPGERNLYVSRYRIGNDRIEQVKRAEGNLLELLEMMLCRPTLPNTPLLELGLLENVSPRQLRFLQGLVEFADQLVTSFNTATIVDVLVRHHAYARGVVDYFMVKFDPAKRGHKKESAEKEAALEAMRKEVVHLTEDRILRMLTEMVRHMVRTNYFLDKEAVAFKVHTHRIEGLEGGTQPRIEAFVYHHELCGVHLRMGPVSRGGLRWSDRLEDYRVEVRSLMLTQEGKNAVIIPSGAKGGFVIKRPREEIDKARFKEYYALYIDAMLDLVDNKTAEGVYTPKGIVRYDGDDTYFVVAADKGTAAMSDTANAIAIERGFWLGDAFASGGSNGYSHKELGITAKGAIRSVERYFIERGIDIYQTPISVVGIGSMNGDVFGNGILLSEKFRLLAAVSHSEIFVDPDPDIAVAYAERKRLFESAPKGGWRYYDPKKISEGGGVFRRDEKSIPLSEQMQKLFKTTRKTMSGEEMVRAILKMEADLLFNGGVGTYVKASWESNLDVGDKANENVRVDAADLRVGAVCEGGNLGFTMPARIEFAQKGGFINLDAIDNSAGVNTSDYEVNLKITLDALVRKGQMDESARIETLRHQAQMVTNRVLWTNYHQSLAISLDNRRSRRDPAPFLRVIDLLERELDVFGRKRFHIPKNDKIGEVLDKEGGLVRPVLGTLLSYAKIFMKRVLLGNGFVDEPYAQEYLLKYFPKSFAAVYEESILNHPLRREIVATVVANRVINNTGITFLADYDRLGKEAFALKIKSYLICNDLFGANDIRYEIFRHDHRMAAVRQYEMLEEIDRTLLYSVDWMLRHLSAEQIHAPTLLRYKAELAKLMRVTERSEVSGETESIDRFFQHLPYLKFAIAVIILHERNHRRFDDTARMMYAIVKELHINEIMRALEAYRPKNDAEAGIRRQLASFIEFSVTSLSERVIRYQRKDETLTEAFESYLRDHEERFSALKESFEAFRHTSTLKNLEEVSLLVNNLLQMTLEEPL
ncbi:MAG: NAD-glutamate dehydrogenase [Epsilonproteobacteria bacterium]|nr:NAD-glutamate dehydrogenase [Campylobacterota bacterium]